MILADKSVWIAHFRHGEPRLTDYLANGLILIHPSVSGELACGNLKNRSAILLDLHSLPEVKLASDTEALALLEDRKLWGRGLGWIDIHLLASALLSSCRFWTLDKRLDLAARDLGLA
ncbi:MAG: PIN domain-containing protein [Bryobacteraceae bacterium]